MRIRQGVVNVDLSLILQFPIYICFTMGRSLPDILDWQLGAFGAPNRELEDEGFDTVDGRNPKQPPGMYKTL